ncbi:hypothetical protein RND81_01G142100 [Saponaria officinalis]|uniref:E3 ubiquitin-protein ligase listerin n=1 Tax=Saponaria officinalis TaxID=3572 RepID=A0AAW1NF85_SAPOF
MMHLISMEDLAGGSDKLADMHQRVISASLSALATVLDVLFGLNIGKADIDDSNNLPKNVSRTQDTTISCAKNMLSAHHNFFIYYEIQEFGYSDYATYSVLRSFIKNIPRVIGEEDVKTLSSTIFGTLQEKHSSCHTA